MRFTQPPFSGAAALAAALALSQAAFAQPQTGTIPYARLHSLQTAFAGIPPADRDKLHFSVVVKHDDASNHAPIGLYVDEGARRTPIAVAASGALDLPSRDDWAKQGLLVRTDQPKGSLSVSISLAILSPASQAVPVGYLLAGMRQAQAALRTGYRQLGGLAGLMAVPALKVVRATLATCCTQTASFQGKPDALPRQDSAAVIALPLGMLRDHAPDTLVFSARLLALDAAEN